MTKVRIRILQFAWVLSTTTIAGCAARTSDEADVPEPSLVRESLTSLDAEASMSVTSVEPPAQCSDEKLAKAFWRGFERGKTRVASVWAEFGDCGHVDAFVERVIERIQELVPDKEKERVRKLCRYVGTMEGVFDELDAIQSQCVTECFLDGDVVGSVKAKTYCDLVIDAAGDLDPVPWIRSPVGTCGLAFEVGCDAQFLATTTAYVNEFGACLPYTADPYYGIWDASRLQSCDYDQSE